MSRFTLWKTTDVQLRGNYEAPAADAAGKAERHLATLDLAATRDILKNNGTLTLSVIDVFNSRRLPVHYGRVPTFMRGNSSQGRLRQINLTLNYRLHQAKKKPKESRWKANFKELSFISGSRFYLTTLYILTERSLACSL
jgi:ferric enterobactin receptor